MKILRLAVVLVVSLAALLGTTSLAGAAPQPKLTPKQQQALCIAKQSVDLLKAIDRQTWRDRKARDAAVRAIPAKAKAACPLEGTAPTPPKTSPAGLPLVTGPAPAPKEGQYLRQYGEIVEAGRTSRSIVLCDEGDTPVAFGVTISPPPSGNDNVGAGGRLTAEGMEVESFNLSGSVAREFQYQLICADTFTPAPPVEPGVFTKTQTSAPGQRSDDLLSCPEGQVIDVNTTAPFGAFGFRNLTPTPAQGELDQSQVSRVAGDGPDGLSPTTVRAILVVSAASTRTFSWQAFVRCTAAA